MLCSITLLYLNQQTRSAPQFPREFSRNFLKFDSSAPCEISVWALLGLENKQAMWLIIEEKAWAEKGTFATEQADICKFVNLSFAGWKILIQKINNKKKNNDDDDDDDDDDDKIRDYISSVTLLLIFCWILSPCGSPHKSW